MITITGTRSKMDPWQYLYDWLRSDNPQDMTNIAYINDMMQHRYPGNYRIAKIWNPKSRNDLHGMSYIFKFDTPEEETMFRLKYA